MRGLSVNVHRLLDAVRGRRNQDQTHSTRVPLTEQRSKFIAAMLQANGGSWPDLEELVAAIYKAYVRPGDLVLDIGVNHGTHIVQLAHLVGDKGEVIGVEAVPAFMAHAREQLQAHNLLDSRVTLHNCAVAAQAGTANFFVTSITDGGLSGLRLRPVMAGEAFDRIEVKTQTLDSLVPPRSPVRFVKIDIEGGEYDAFRGAGTILSQRPLIAFEFDCSAPKQFGFDAQDLVNLLESYNYTICDIFGFAIETGSDMMGALVWNFIAIPKGSTPAAITAPVRQVFGTRYPTLSDCWPRQ